MSSTRSTRPVWDCHLSRSVAVVDLGLTSCRHTPGLQIPSEALGVPNRSSLGIGTAQLHEASVSITPAARQRRPSMGAMEQGSTSDSWSILDLIG